MGKFAVILPAAGQSSRFRKGDRKKTFVDLKGRPVWLRAAEHFVNREDVVQTLVVIAPEDMDWFKEKFRPNLAFFDVQLVPGGAERSDSVRNALQQLDATADYVAIHDAARPLLTKTWVDRVFDAARQSGAAILGIPVTSTLKQVRQGTIESTVDRRRYWMAQTPQVFRRDLLEAAYGQLRQPATDDAQVVELSGVPVQVVEGSPMNLKITTADDFRMATALVDALPKEKGLRALHPFADEEPRLL